ncbi:hypothetical protein PX860_28450 (plasmid) [Agrobacterium leguminum]|uniref:hypothetical protein n=1 Tax=Agrobacterium leguminum TaxID=2792015 RepID=UPI00272BEC33|nr:hypothetical protein [Agrobacterium leguminum]WLE01028.1 hypothetical protein PX860_28450 [Agrobacterium leguminum]
MRVLLAALMLICGGCAALPSKTDLDSFGTATSNSANTVAAAVAASSQVASDQDEQLQAMNYVRGRAYALVEVPQSTRVKRLDPDQLAIRLAALRDLQGYAKAVAKAADQGTVDQLEAAAEKLTTSVATLATAVGGAPVVAPAIKLAGRAATYAVSDSYVREVLGIIRKTDPVVKELVDLLQTDLGPMQTDLQVQAAGYAGLRDQQLAVLRQDPRVSRAALYDAYMNARADIKGRYALSEAAAPITELLQSIYDTHHALATGAGDVGLTIKRLSALAQDSAAVIQAVKKDSGE